MFESLTIISCVTMENLCIWSGYAACMPWTCFLILLPVVLALATADVEGTVRLADGSSPDEGRVEVYHMGQWGTVCDDFWGLPDAMVVCRQLGHLTAVDAPTSAFFGPGTGPIWYDNVGCAGTEENITQCPHPGLGIENCAHAEDAGAICESEIDMYGHFMHFNLAMCMMALTSAFVSTAMQHL